MTHAASLSSLTRSVSGNIAYAVLATAVARREQFHRIVLMSANGAPILAAPVIHRRAAMLAYDDSFSLLAVISLIAIPMLLMLPKRGYVESPGAAPSAALAPVD